MDLKIKDVAELLNVSEATIRRWLSRGKIPAYRLNRQYRFSQSEIEDWILQQKLGVNLERSSDPEELPKSGNMQFSLYRALYRGEVYRALSAKKEEIFKETLREMAKKFELDPEVLTDLFLDREKMMPTALTHGIAVPHTRDFFLDTHFDMILVVYPKTPIDYGALDGAPVHTLFFLFACEGRNHLNLLAKLAFFASDEKARHFLLTKPTKEQLLVYVKEWETCLN